MVLADLRRGETAIIKKLPDNAVRAQAIRFGISEGSKIACQEKLPAGPVVITRGLMEYAIGRKLAEKIEVEVAR